jgi:GTP-binding protein
MKISTATFFKSASALSGCPKPTRPEFAFIGRSNVGKSSLINMICLNKKLAKTSGTPGKTNLINHFLINEEWYLVDLPGYGFAKVGKSQKAEFEKLITDYCTKRESLIYLFILVDARLPLQKIDAEFMYWCGENSIPFILVFTKADKLTKNELQKNLAAYKKQLAGWWEELPPMIISSSETGVGRDEILKVIEENKEFFKLPEKKV